MITIIHGDDITKSRKFFIELRSKQPAATTIQGTEVDLTVLSQILDGGSFFSDEKAVFIESLISGKKNSAEYKEIIKYLLNRQLPAEIVLWEGKELDKSSLSPYKEATIKQFKLPQSLFTLLDNLKPKNGVQLLKLFHQTLNATEEDAVFYMLVRHFRLLMAVHSKSESRKVRKLESNNFQTLPLSNSPTTISELKRLQPWQLTKLKKQSLLFPFHRLIFLYKELYKIESDYKTGNLSGPLSNSIDIFLLGI